MRTRVPWLDLRQRKLTPACTQLRRYFWQTFSAKSSRPLRFDHVDDVARCSGTGTVQPSSSLMRRRRASAASGLPWTTNVWRGARRGLVCHQGARRPQRVGRGVTPQDLQAMDIRCHRCQANVARRSIPMRASLGAARVATRRLVQPLDSTAQVAARAWRRLSWLPAAV